MARLLEEEDALPFAGGSGRAHLSSRAEMGPGLVHATRFRQKKMVQASLGNWICGLTALRAGIEKANEILTGEFRKVPEQNQGVWEEDAE